MDYNDIDSIRPTLKETAVLFGADLTMLVNLKLKREQDSSVFESWRDH